MINLIDLIFEEIPYDVFSYSTLSNFLNGSANSKHALIKRAIAQGKIIHLRKGLYCLAEKYRRKPLDFFALAQQMYGPSYISFESSLSYHGWIPESVPIITSASMMRSKEFKTPLGVFSFYRVPSSIFYQHVEAVSSVSLGQSFMARPLKAVMDYVYIHKKDWKGLAPLIKSLRIETEFLSKLTMTELSSLKHCYPSRHVQRFIQSLEKELTSEC